MSSKKSITVKLRLPEQVKQPLSQPKTETKFKRPAKKAMFDRYDLRHGAGMATIIHQNDCIVEMLTKLIEYSKKVKASCTNASDKKKHGFRITSFVKARDAIKDWDKAITSGSQAQKDIKGVGKGVAGRIEEWLQTGTLVEFNIVAEDERTRAIMELTQISGIGEKKAATLVDTHNVTSVADLVEKYKKGEIRVAKNQLTSHIAVGLEYFYDIQQRIPWSEVDHIRELLDELIHKFDKDMMFMVCGSYRRQKTTCGDIDVLLCNPLYSTDAEATKNSPLEKLVEFLKEKDFLVGSLTEHGKTKYMGVCKLSPDAPGRRIDIRFISRQAWAPAVLYFTGSGKFNKLMRYEANRRGYTISEYGIYYYINGTKGESVDVLTEKDIFDVLNFVYLEPTEREFS